MSDFPNNPIEIVDESPMADGVLAERYIEKELSQSRASLVRTRIVGSVLAGLTIIYVGYLTVGFRNSLEPVGAAQIATGLASQRLDDLEPKFADYIHEQVPLMIRKAPDQVIARMPEYRKHLEDRVLNDLRTQAASGADQLSKDLDTFLTAHKDEVATLIKDGQDPAATEKMGSQLEAEFRTFLHEIKIAGTSIDEKLSQTLSTLREVQTRTARLAANKGLSPSEKTARHAVALLMRKIDLAKASSDPLPVVNLETTKAAITEVSARLKP